MKKTLIGFYPSLSRRVAIYCTWSPSGQVSDMVLKQIEAYRDAGYDVVVVSNSPTLDPVLRQDASFVLHRDNIDHDFGAWRDAMPFVLQHYDDLDEVLLVNDSVLGPVNPLGPVLRRMQQRPKGVAGMTDCWLYNEHLQSYCILASGTRAINELALFLATLTPFASKSDVIQRGEIGLTLWMMSAGLHVGAEYGYSRLVSQCLREDVDWLNAIRPPRRKHRDDPYHYSRDALVERINDRPLNPTHHLWLPLIRKGFPWIKTDLVRRNPGRVPGVEYLDVHWPADAPVTIAEAKSHLRLFAA